MYDQGCICEVSQLNLLSTNMTGNSANLSFVPWFTSSSGSSIVRYFAMNSWFKEIECNDANTAIGSASATMFS